jgi:poly(hydroxyalkanoate) depolymerase family esterase
VTTPFYQRLKRASGLADTAGLKPVAKLTEVAATIQRALGKRDGTDTLTRPVAFKPTQGLPNAVKATLKAFGSLTLPGLEDRPPASGSAPAPSPAMLSRSYVSGSGNRPYKLFVPVSMRAGAPLLVMLHGCTQSAEDFAAGTRMNALAEAHGWVVIYPEQVASANMQRCWNWFNPNDQQRGQGEAEIIAGMTRLVMAEFRSDPRGVFIAGLSAGGAQAAILGAAYPDLYAAIGVHSGLACGAAHDMMSAFSAMQQGRPGAGTLAVPAIVFHGDRDSTVHPRNADEVAAGLASGGTEKQEQGTAPGGLSYTRKTRFSADGKPILEQWSIHGAGHAWSGGSKDGSYTEPRGPDASAEMLRFFLSVR